MLIADFPAFGGNLYAHASNSSVASSPAVTASASLSQLVEQVADCNPCMIVTAWSSISRVYWFSLSLGVILDTVSLAVTQYNNTAITRTSTVYGNIDSVNMSTVVEAQSIASFLSIGAFGGDFEYDGFMGVLLGNATKGNDDAFDLPAYPTPYLAIDGLQYFSLSSQVDGCPLAKRGSSHTCSCPMNSIAYRWVENAQNPFDTRVPSVSLTSTYYETLVSDDFTREMQVGFRNLNNESFSSFLSSASVFKSYPELRSCAVFHFLNGPPQVMIPALALATTVATTTTDPGPHRHQHLNQLVQLPQRQLLPRLPERYQPHRQNRQHLYPYQNRHLLLLLQALVKLHQVRLTLLIVLEAYLPESLPKRLGNSLLLKG